MNIRLVQPDPEELLAIRNGADRYRGSLLAKNALPPRSLLDQSRHLLSKAPHSYRWTAPYFMLDTDSDTIIGSIGGKGLLEGENEVELGYNVAPRYQNRGVAKQAIALITRLAIAADLSPLAHVEPHNEYSARALRANGYVSEGTIVLPAGFTLERYRYLPDQDDTSLEGLGASLGVDEGRIP